MFCLQMFSHHLLNIAALEKVQKVIHHFYTRGKKRPFTNSSPLLVFFWTCEMSSVSFTFWKQVSWLMTFYYFFSRQMTNYTYQAWLNNMVQVNCQTCSVFLKYLFQSKKRLNEKSTLMWGLTCNEVSNIRVDW